VKLAKPQSFTSRFFTTVHAKIYYSQPVFHQEKVAWYSFLGLMHLCEKSTNKLRPIAKGLASRGNISNENVVPKESNKRKQLTAVSL